MIYTYRKSPGVRLEFVTVETEDKDGNKNCHTIKIPSHQLKHTNWSTTTCQQHANNTPTGAHQLEHNNTPTTAIIHLLAVAMCEQYQLDVLAFFSRYSCCPAVRVAWFCCISESLSSSMRVLRPTGQTKQHQTGVIGSCLVLVCLRVCLLGGSSWVAQVGLAVTSFYFILLYCIDCDTSDMTTSYFEH